MPAGTPVTLDHVFFFLMIAVSPLVDLFWLYPWLRRASAAGVPGVRSRAYFWAILGQWVGTACVLALWVGHARPWIALRLGAGSPLGLGIGLALVTACVVLLGLQRRAIFAKPERLDIVLRQIGNAGPLLPRTPGELGGFMLLSITAGICEELLYRGYVIWYLNAWTGLAGAVVISSILFGAGHLYLDRRSALKAGIVGAVMAGIVILSGSLWPAMILHAAIDMNSGSLTFRALTRAREGNPGPGLPAAA
jgi:membrane protease YdiL (CAAX protease family)